MDDAQRLRRHLSRLAIFPLPGVRRTPPAIVLGLALAVAGCPDSLERHCPSNSLPSGNFSLTLTLQHTPDECLVVKTLDGGPPPPPEDASIVPQQPQAIDSTLCAGASDGGATIYLLVATSGLVRDSAFDGGGGFTFVSPPLLQRQTLCNCLADLNETISGALLGGGATGFTLGPDGGGLVPQPTGLDASVVQTLTNPDGGVCLCNLPCAEHYTLTGSLNR
jgi:hypothetical protein